MKDNHGALLITFIIFITLVGILASSIAYLLQNESYAIRSENSVEQSYYLSESGLRYVIMKIKEGKNYNELKDTYEYDNLTIQIPKVASRTPQSKNIAGNISLKFNKGELQKRGDIFIHSYAQVDTESFVESKRQLNAEYEDANNLNIDFEVKHFDQDQNASDDDRIWNLTDTFYAKIDSINTISSLQLKSDQQWNWVLSSLNWGKNDKLPDLRLYQYVITKVLSYKIQIKVNCYPSYKQKGRDFMAGLNFRVINDTNYDRDRIAYYGISLFKSAGREQGNPPCWLIDDSSSDCNQHLGDSFQFEGEEDSCQDPKAKCLVPNVPYVIFWVKTERRNKIDLLAYCDLRSTQGADNFIKKLKPLEWGFKEWLNIGAFIKEKESAGQKINEVQIGLRATNEETNWDFPLKLRFVKVGHNDPGSSTNKLSDRSILSKDLSIINQIPPDEIGFHALYDNRIKSSFYKYDIYFNDFRLDCHGEYCTQKSEKLTQF
jgi:hypothetical protein